MASTSDPTKRTVDSYQNYNNSSPGWDRLRGAAKRIIDMVSPTPKPATDDDDDEEKKKKKKPLASTMDSLQDSSS